MQESAFVSNKDLVAQIASLLAVDASALEAAFTSRTVSSGGMSYTSSFNNGFRATDTKYTFFEPDAF